MDLNCNLSLGDRYASSKQRVRVITEGWWAAEGYCLNCETDALRLTTAGTKAADVFCTGCPHEYELKSGAKPHGLVVPDGSYAVMMERFAGGKSPALLLLHYSAAWRVQQLTAVHPLFITPAMVRKRTKPHLRASGAHYWMCDLNMANVPPDAKVDVVRDGVERDHAVVRREYQMLRQFETLPAKQRGWAGLVLAQVRRLGTEFTLAEVYDGEAMMRAAYPENRHVRDKIRQQLQVLRDLGYVEFLARGRYRSIGPSVLS